MMDSESNDKSVCKVDDEEMSSQGMSNRDPNVNQVVSSLEDFGRQK